MSSRVTGKPPTHWRRPMTRTYDYNTALGENYYKPQLEYLETRRGRGKTPPSAATYAERLLKYPTSQRSSSASRRAEESSSEVGLSRTSARRDEDSHRYSSLDDLGFDEDLLRRRRQLLLQSSQENLADISGPLSPGTGRQNRLAFGDKLLDAIGVKEGISGSQQQQSSLSSSTRIQKQSLMSSSSSTRGEEDALDQILAERKNRRAVGFVQSAEADLVTEDPLKSPRVSLSSRLQSAREQMDQLREETRQDSDASTSRFRKRIQQRRAREEAEDNNDYGGFTASSKSAISNLAASKIASSASSASRSAVSTSSSGSSKMKITSGLSASAQNLMDDDDAETAAILSKVEQIRKRAKARLDAIASEDFPELQIESSLASRRAVTRSRQDLDDDLDADFGSSSKSGRSLAMSKRTVRASYEIE